MFKGPVLLLGALVCGVWILRGQTSADAGAEESSGPDPAVASEAPQDAARASDELGPLRARISLVQDALIGASVGSEDVLGLLVELLELREPNGTRRPGGGWLVHEWVKRADVSIEVAIGPPDDGVRPILVEIRTDRVPTLARPVNAQDARLKIHVGVGAEKLDYCATSLLVRIPPSRELYEQLLGNEPMCTGATYELRDGKEARAQVLTEVTSRHDGRFIKTSRLSEPQQNDEFGFSDLPEVPHLYRSLRALVEN